MTVTENTINKHLDLTKSAQEHVKSLLKEKEEIGIRIGIRDSGCSGYAYFLEFAKDIKADDYEFLFEGFKVIVDKKSFTFINGTTVDFIKEGVNSNLTFINPNVSAQCGCGESFSI